VFDFIPDPVIGGGGSGHSQNTDSYLATPVTNLLYVDKRRTDVYVECGSITKPYKTINAALAAITTNSDSNRFVVLISPGTYSEQITTKAFVYLVSEYPDSVLITQSTGHTVIVPSASGAAAGLRGLNLENLSASNLYNAVHLDDGGSLAMVDCSALSVGGKAAEINDGSFLVAHNVSFQSNENDGVMCRSGGSFMLDGGTQAGKDGTTWDVSVESGGWMTVTGSLALANGRLNAVGTVEYRTRGSCIGNDSTVSGGTIKAALETLAALPQATHLLYVDNGRTDTYTPDGTIIRPYRTIQAAIDRIVANGDNSSSAPYVVNISAGVYPENVALESDKLVDVGLVGATNRGTVIDPPTGCSIRSEVNNDGLLNLHVHHIFTNKLVSLIGASDGTSFGSDIVFDSCYIHAGLTTKNVNSVNFVGYWEMYGPVLVSNVAGNSFIGEAGIKDATITIESDGSANYPVGCSGHDIYVVFANTLCGPNITYNFVNGGTGTVTFRMGNRIGTNGGTTTVPSGCNLLAYDSTLRGNYVLNAGGALTLSNAHVTGTITGAGTLTLEEKASQIKNDSSVTGVSVKDALQTLATPPQVTKVLHVDKNRTDSYTPDGSVDRPFLTIGAATAIAGDGCLLKVVPATYSEDVTLPTGVSLEGYGANRLVLSGNVTISAGNVVSLRYVTLSGTDKTLTINANCILMDGYASCAVVVNGTATIQAWNFHMVGAASGVTPLTMNSTGKFQSFLATIGSTGDAPAINQTAGQVILNTVLTSASRAGGPVIVSTGGTAALLNSQAINSLGGPAVDLSANGATAANPNMISGLVAVGNVVCGSKVTAVEGLRFINVGSLSGTAIVHRPASWIDNDSTVAGDTVKDALETLGAVPDPSALANNDYVLRVTDGVASWVVHT
jgi:hypothetical protein